ncbi:MAG: hypothetical protein JJLCMIEE_02117 [Acidimicrobiales bacterium]|nr:hypothetical protein [Acidimicrobiales bacterium]
MAELILFRHGKSDWSSVVPDADRPLNKRGRRAAAAMGELLTGVDKVPDGVLVSPTARTQETLELAMGAGGWSCAVRTDGRLYGGGARAALSAVLEEDDATQRLLVVGHEPTTSELLALLLGGGDYRVPTAAMALIDLAAERWDHVRPASGRLEWLLPPRLLRSASRPS